MRATASYRAERRNNARRQKAIKYWRRFGKVQTKEGANFVMAPGPVSPK